MPEMHGPKSKRFGIRIYSERNNNRGKAAAKKPQKVANPENPTKPNLIAHPIKLRVKFANYASFSMRILFVKANCFLFPERSKAKSIFPKTIPPQ